MQNKVFRKRIFQSHSLKITETLHTYEYTDIIICKKQEKANLQSLEPHRTRIPRQIESVTLAYTHIFVHICINTSVYRYLRVSVGVRVCVCEGVYFSLFATRASRKRDVPLSRSIREHTQNSSVSRTFVAE